MLLKVHASYCMYCDGFVYRILFCITVKNNSETLPDAPGFSQIYADGDSNPAQVDREL